MHDAFGDPLVIEVGNFLTEVIFQQRWTAIARFERMQIIVDRQPVIRRRNSAVPASSLVLRSKSFRFAAAELLRPRAFLARTEVSCWRGIGAKLCGAAIRIPSLNISSLGINGDHRSLLSAWHVVCNRGDLRSSLARFDSREDELAIVAR